MSGSGRRCELLFPWFPLLLRESPPTLGLEGLSRIGSARTDCLVLTDDRIKGALDRRLHRVFQQEEFFEASLEDMNAVLEVGLDSGRAPGEWGLLG